MSKNHKNPRKNKKAVPKAAPPPRKPRNLKTLFTRRPTVDQFNALSEIQAARPPVRLGREDSCTLTGAVEAKTPGQVATELCGEWYARLQAEEPKLLAATAVMVAFRRAYAVALRELNEVVDAARAAYEKKGQNVPHTLNDFIVQYAMYLASKPFTEHDLMKGVIETVLPWLAETVDAHTAKDAEGEIEARVRANEARAARPVPVGFKHTPAQEGTGLARDRPLVLVGWANALGWLLDQACNSVLAARDEQTYTVLRLMRGAPRTKDQHARLVRLGTSAWAGCTNSDRDMATLLAKFVAPTVNDPIDLVVCDDVGLANTTGFVGRHPAACAGDANRRFRKWCAELGAAFLGALPQPTRDLPDLGGPEFEQLKTFSHMRPVQVLDGDQFDRDDHYRLLIGSEAAVIDVPKDILDTYSPPSVLAGV